MKSNDPIYMKVILGTIMLGFVLSGIVGIVCHLLIYYKLVPRLEKLKGEENFWPMNSSSHMKVSIYSMIITNFWAWRPENRKREIIDFDYQANITKFEKKLCQVNMYAAMFGMFNMLLLSIWELTIGL